MISAQDIKKLAHKKEIYHYMSMVGYIEDTYNINTEDCKGSFAHYDQWLIKQGYSKTETNTELQK
jgi:hypothetical protein